MTPSPSRLTVLQTWTPSPPEASFIADRWPDALILHLDDLDEAALADALPEIDAVVGYIRTFPRGIVARAPKLRMIHLLGHGTDGLLSADDFAQVRDRDIVIARSDPAAICIAEFVLMNMIALSRRVIRLHTALIERGDWSTDLWRRRGEGVIGGELHGSVVGIVGYGAIGREVHVRAQAFGMRVGALSRTPEHLGDRGLDFVASWDDLDEFLARCDYLVLTIPLTPETRGMLGPDQFAQMKQGSFLINVSRGPLVDEDALWDALSSGRLAGAALDVFEAEESHGREDYPTRRPFQHLNTVFTPHIAGATAEARFRALDVMGRNLANLRDGRPIENATPVSALTQ